MRHFRTNIKTYELEMSEGELGGGGAIFFKGSQWGHENLWMFYLKNA